MKAYSLVGKKLVECSPEEILESMIGMIVDEKDEMIRLILKPDAKKKQRETLMQKSAEFNKDNFAGTYLVSHLENPGIIKSFIEEMKDEKSEPTTSKKKKKAKKKKKRKKEAEDQAEEEVSILDRWDPDLVKKLVAFLDGKTFVSLLEIEEFIEKTEGEAYWLTQDLIHSGIVPGRWTGYETGEWVYQVLSEQPLSKSKTPKKTKTKKKSTKKKSAPKKAAKKKD